MNLSIVIPIYCEEENLPELYERLVMALAPMEKTFEIIFVNDHSRDRSLEIMREIHARDPRVKIVSFSRNFGHQTALTAGMQFASGEAVILMDGDLQDPPEVLPDLIKKHDLEGWDIVYAVRRKRKESLLIRAMYAIFYRLLRGMSYVDIPLDAGDFCIMSRRVVDQINRIPERNRFVRGLRSWVGYRQTGMEYERAARNAGKPKYSYASLLRLALDGMVSFSFIPLRVSTILGTALSIAGIAYAIYIAVLRVMGRFQGLYGWSTIVVAVLILGGVQLIMLGIIGEYLGRIYEEIKGRPQYIVESLVGFDDSRAK